MRHTACQMQRRCFIITVAAVSLFIGCAKVGSPPGGPEDKTPPRVVFSSPPDSAVRVDRNTVVRIEFSERMQKESVERALFISPYPDPYPRLVWSRGDKTIALTFDGPLDSNRTYVITVGTDARDAHGNRIISSVTFAFSTGEQMSSGRIAGTVSDAAGKPAVGATVGLYSLEGIADGPDPSLMYPLYTSQAGADGEFSFGYLGAGTYRVFAWKDREADDLLGPDEEVAVPARDARCEEGGAERLPKMHLASSDHRPPELMLVRALDRSHVELRFDEEVVADSLNVEIVVPDTLSVHVISDAKPLRTIVVHTSDQRPGCSYGLKLVAVDQAGNRAQWDPDTTFFDSVNLPDTTAPRLLTAELPDLIISDTLAYLRLWFDDALGAVAFDSLAVVQDSIRIGGIWRQEEVNRLVFVPSEPLPSGRRRWRIPLGDIRDIAGNRARDTVTIWPTRVPPDSLGELTGTVTDTVEVGRDGNGPVVIEARPLRGDWRVRTPIPGSVGRANMAWRMDALPTGGYTLFAWRDRNEDGVWSPGTAFPFQPSERWAASDTVYVRARWISTGVTISFE